MTSIQRRDFLKTMTMLHENELLPQVVVIGSWAEYLYMAAGGLPGYEAAIRTLDVDILLRNKSLKPCHDLPSLAKSYGYLLESDRLSGTTKLLLPGSLEVEFLLAKRGAGHEPAMDTNIGICAQTLRHLEILARHTVALDFEGLSVTVPEPEAFVLHKMVINQERGNKTEKDQQVIRRMMPYLDAGKCKDLIEDLPKQSQQKIHRYLQEHEGLETDAAGWPVKKPLTER